MVFAEETGVPALPRSAAASTSTRRGRSRPSTSTRTSSATVAQQNGVQQYGTIVFNYKGRTERVTANTEQDITNAIIKVVSGQQKKVYFTPGHGEKDTTSAERDGYGAIAEALKRENYAVEKVVLAQTGAVPDDAAVVVVAGPQTDFFPPEIDALKTYLGKDGKLLLVLDPPDKIGRASRSPT